MPSWASLVVEILILQLDGHIYGKLRRIWIIRYDFSILDTIIWILKIQWWWSTTAIALNIWSLKDSNLWLIQLFINRRKLFWMHLTSCLPWSTFLTVMLSLWILMHLRALAFCFSESWFSFLKGWFAGRFVAAASIFTLPSSLVTLGNGSLHSDDDWSSMIFSFLLLITSTILVIKHCCFCIVKDKWAVIEIACDRNELELGICNFEAYQKSCLA